MRNLIRLFTGVAVAALFTLAPGHVRAQGVTSAAIEGVVTDASGQPVVGANVTGVHTPSGSTYSTVTRSGGNYTLSNVKVGGPYTVTVSSSGSATKRVSGINTDLSQATRVNVALGAGAPPSPIASEAAAAPGDPSRVIVEASVVDDEIFSPTRSGTATNVGRAQIESLPTISRSLQDFTRVTPQVNGGSVGGANNRFNNISIDGATINDAFGLEASGLLTARSEPISLDVVDQVRVSLSPYDVRQSNFTGGSIDAVTKSGTNKFHGSLYGFYRDADFVGRTTFTTPTPANERGKFRSRLNGFEEYTYGLTLGGPIIKDKLFFFVGYERKSRTEPQLGSIGVSSDGSGFFTTLATTNTAAVINTTINQYNYNPGTTGTSLDRVRDDKYFARIDWNITKDQKLTLRYNHVESEFTDGASRSNAAYTLTGRQYLRPYSSDSVVAQLFSTWSPTFTTEARVAYNRLRTERQVATPFSSVAVLVDSGKTLNFGVERSSQQNQLDQDVIESVLNASYFFGNHTFTAGINVDNFSYRNFFVQDAFGTYTFTTPAQYAAGTPARYQNSYLLPGGNDTVNWSYFNLGFYLQDEWKVTKNLTVTLGVRADMPIFPDDPRRNERFATDFAGRDTSKLPSGQVVFSPRFGFNWNVFGTDFNSTGEAPVSADAKGGPYTTSRKRWWELGTVVRGGAGVFNGKTPSVWISNQYSNTGLDFARIDTNLIQRTTTVRATGAQSFSTVTLGSTNFNSTNGITVPLNPGNPADTRTRVVPIPLFSANPNGQLTIAQVNAALAAANYSTPTSDVSFAIPANQTAIAITNSNFNFPQLFRANLAIDQKLPWGFVLTLEGLLSRNIEAVTYKNLNLPAALPLRIQDGRSFYPSAGANAAYSSVIEIGNTSKGYSYIGTVSLERPMQKDGWSFKVAYTRSNVRTAGDYTSSVAFSNWQNNVITDDPNNPRTTRSFFEIRDRLIASISYGINVGKPWQTTFSLFYDGHSGQPYSVVFGSDINRDGISGNDSFYVPRDASDVTITVPTITGATPAQQAAANAAGAAAFFAYVDSQKFLRDNKGRILPVNGGTNPWVNRLDLRITQGIPIPSRFGKLEAYFDVLNVLNLISSRWGGVKTYGGSLFNNVFFSGVTASVNQTTGAYTYQVTPANFPAFTTPTGTSGSFSSPSAGQANLDARWQMQFGLRYTF
ncbi:MAG: TonB-dependent receptor [Verrucomicrobia bacterium]|nr:TonB-dependent receptor [Verrucomicrobiota bacterium]